MSDGSEKPILFSAPMVRGLCDYVSAGEAMRDDLMLLPPSALAYARNVVRKRGHAGIPGSGPKEESCRSCAHKRGVQGGRKTFYKCELNRRNWTGGPGSDIHLKDPACEFWSAPEDTLP